MLSDSVPDSPSPSWLARFWAVVPDWAFRLPVIAILLSVIIPEVLHWIESKGRFGPYIVIDGEIRHMPFVPILVHLTYVMIVVGYLLRVPPRRRADRVATIVIPGLAAFMPMFPFWISAWLGFVSPTPDLAASTQPAGTLADWAHRFNEAMALGELSVERAWVFVILVSIGNALDVWSYAVLCRSISIVAEARELVTRAPYRWIRHPVYLGQIIAQSAIWVVLPRGWSGWWVYFAVFVALQLYRSRIEERVLESAFGDAYRAYRRRAVWFWP